MSEANSKIISNYRGQDIYAVAVDLLRKELGVPYLATSYRGSRDEFDEWFLGHSTTDELLDSIEIIARIIAFHAKNLSKMSISNDFASEMNARMAEAGFGYQIEQGQIVEISSQFIHSEIVVESLKLISHSKFSSVDTEFRQAHSEFRAGSYEDCIHDCGNALESTLKIILTEKG
jgi:hypothetical protein